MIELTVPGLKAHKTVKQTLFVEKCPNFDELFEV